MHHRLTTTFDDQRYIFLVDARIHPAFRAQTHILVVPRNVCTAFACDTDHLPGVSRLAAGCYPPADPRFCLSDFKIASLSGYECLGYLTPDASCLAASDSHHLSCSRPRIRLTTLCESMNKQKLARCQVTNNSHEIIVKFES